MSTAPKYINRNYIYPPPYTCQNVMMYCFIVGGDKDKINALLNKTLNLPENNNTHYYAPTHYLMMTFVHMEKVIAGGDFANRGYSSETELAIWIPTLAQKKILGDWVIDPLAPKFFTPYLFIDNPVGLSGGREIYGYAKEYGRLEVAQDPYKIDTMTVDVFTLETYTPESKAGMFRLITLDKLEEGKVPDGQWENLGEVFDTAMDHLNPHLPDIKLPSSLFKMSIPQVFLKQFRDIVNPLDACYQAVVEADAQVDRFTGWLLPGKYLLTVEDLAGVPLDHDLGLRGAQEPVFSYWLNLDMTLDNGKIIWQAP